MTEGQTGAAANTENAGKPDDDVGRQRSTIGFPYMDLDDALTVIHAIHNNVGSGNCTDDQLAPWLGISANSSGYRVRLSTTRLFGLIEASPDGGLQLSDLGKRAVDSHRTREAKVEAFLNVPLYSRIFEAHKGGALPPPAALEREIVGYGVSDKQKARARQCFERSAEVAGFFESGKDRLVKPAIKTSSGASDAPKGEDGVKGSGDGRNGNGNGGGFDASGLHPFIQGLLKTLPSKEGTDWPIKDRVKWLRLAASAFDMIYEGEGTVSIKVGDNAE